MEEIYRRGKGGSLRFRRRRVDAGIFALLARKTLISEHHLHLSGKVGGNVKTTLPAKVSTGIKDGCSGFDVVQNTPLSFLHSSGTSSFRQIKIKLSQLNI